MANERARDLRRNQTNAERALWRALRQKQIDGCRFRRQHPMGDFIVDFICFERKLILELDGSQHAEREAIESDWQRDAWLRAQGYHVARFWNNDVYENIDGILLTISELLQTGKRPTSHP